MNKRKIMMMALALCMVAIIAVGGTLAYFTDTDSAVNVMTLGKVDIEQNEQEFVVDENGNRTDELKEFAQDKPLMPMVDTREEGAPVVVDGYFNPAMKNVVDKIVTVTNEAEEGAINQDAYVRTILAFETATEYAAGTETVLRDGKTIFDTYIGTLGDFELLSRDTVMIDGVEYVLAVKVYEEALAPQEESDPSLKQVFLSPNANNEVMNLFGEEYTILALSQGVQTAGFASAEAALNEAFGDLETIDEATLVGWFEEFVVED